MNAPTAWDIGSGSEPTVVAVLDSGFSLDHEDLVDRWQNNDGELGTTTLGDNCWMGIPEDKASNGCDDDKNGYIDDWRGWDFYNGTNNPAAGQENTQGDAVGHGTEVAGLVGATGNNAKGIATLNWSTKILPLKVLSDDGPGYSSDIAAAIYYAVDNGANVINLSLGGNEADPTLLSATDYAYDNNVVVVVAAAGNCGTGTSENCISYDPGIIGYPARNPNVISVGATTNSKQRASFSSYGAALDVVAPGSGAIYSPTYTASNPTTLYSTSLYGTSFASPYVASLASLIKSIRPNTSVDDITAIILGTAQKTNITNGIYSDELGHGIVDAAKSLNVATSLNQASEIPDLYQTGGPKSEHSYIKNTEMASGCKTTAPQTYCAVRFQNDLEYDRFLPYQQTGNNSYSSWSWNSSLLAGEAWWIRSVQGDAMSADYFLWVK
jgi:subtilisin family serine protease